MSASQVALTAHQVIPAGNPDNSFLQNATESLHDQFEIQHVTLQVVRAPFCDACDADRTSTIHS